MNILSNDHNQNNNHNLHESNYKHNNLHQISHKNNNLQQCSHKNSNVYQQNHKNNNLYETSNKNNNIMFNQRKLNIKNHKIHRKEQASNYLKTQITYIINDQIKAYRIQKKMQKQLQQYNKKKQNLNLRQNIHQIDKFRQKQSQNLKDRLQKYLELKQKKQDKIQQINLKKNVIIQRKKYQNQSQLQKVLQRHYQTENRQIDNRLSRINSYSSKKSISMSRSKITSSSRNVSSAQNHREFITSKIQQLQLKRVTNYLNKMKLAQSRIIQKQIKNQQRKQKSIKSQIKNLINQRINKQQQFTKKIENQYNQKMGSFYQNITKYQMENSTFILNKSLMKSSLRQKVLKNKQNHQKKIANKIIQNFNKKKQNKQNIRENYKRKLDYLRTKSSLINRSIKLQKQAIIQQNQKKLKILYEKLNKIKKMKSTQIVSQKQKQQILNLIHNQDPQYAEILDFLAHSRSDFMKKKIQQEEEKNKNQKIKKTARFTNKI